MKQNAAFFLALEEAFFFPSREFFPPELFSLGLIYIMD